ncbi:hypothetical protein CAPN004_09060 [Capnocytophaga cynodegmi]|uniref:hypothetical protein n=1 Tax=Capnocytophaga cynodegmi TaxID=28189 RepID=UPI001AC7AEB1|nr:hypothetical protein [Capnocytophaga cynodegmi]GIM51876.1 hypothetical protein CAPN004_09060 [Capnocytophaga cynodegmi]
MGRKHIHKDCRWEWVEKQNDHNAPPREEWVCDYEEREITDWNYPELISEKWKPGTPIPSNQNITVIFPQLFLLAVYSRYNQATWRYSIELEENDFIEIVVPEGKRFDAINENSFDDVQKRTVNFQVRYKNFHLLTDQPQILAIKYKVFASDQLVEEKSTSFSLQKTDTDTPEVTNIPVLNMTCNAVSKQLSGDTSVQFFSNKTKGETSEFELVHFLSDASVRIPSISGDNFDAIPFEVEFNALGYRRELKFIRINETYFSNKRYKNIDFTKSQTIQTQASQNVLTEIYRERNLVGRRKTKTYPFIINLTIANDAFYFEINKKTFHYELFREDKSKAKGQFTIKNPNLLTFSFEKSNFLNVTNISGNGTEQVIVAFESNTADTLKMGEHKGFIKVIGSPENQQVVSVLLQIKQNVDFDAREIYFCKDKNTISIRKNSPESEFVRAEVRMLFSGYGRKIENIQRYDYVFFEEYVNIDIGDEVQDFFEDIPSLEVLNINENKLLQPKEIFRATRVDVTITETNFKGETFKTHTFTDLHFLPGKKPEAFPFLTRATLRSTYSDSLISVCALTRDVKALNLNEIASNLTDLTLLKDTLGVANFAFRRNVADKTYSSAGIINKENLSLEPKPESGSVLIDAVFQNQNFCPDWFSFTDDYEVSVNFEHTIADNVLKSQDYKAFVKTKRTFKLNTGWIFPEEIELLWELIKSPLCYLKINNKWIKVIPITQKPLSFDSYRNLHNMIVEFQLANKE